MKTSITLIAVAFTLVLASCSGSRYGHVPKGKKQKQVATQNTPVKKRLNERFTAITKKAEIEKATTDNSVAMDYKVEVPAAPKADNYSPKTRRSSAEKNAVEQSRFEEQVLSPEKTSKIKENTAVESERAEHSWLWYIIVGLIFLLLAAIIPWTLGWIFYIVGVIAIIVGLLALLGIV
jgi:hypothetical protein